MTGCEWNPEAKRPVLLEERSHALADVMINRGEWLVCQACSRTAEFKKYRKRVQLSNPTKERP